MPRLSPDAAYYTLVNVFTVSPDDQEKLYRHLVDVTERTIRHLPGFVSATFHLGNNGRHVVNYAQWESEETFRSMHALPELQEHFAFCRGIATPLSVPCAVAQVFEEAAG
uniref:Tcm F1 monooxygenase n=1 Tax=Streptomyces olivaceus TaxID=47716 RepID=Q9L4Y0_STROV|nr:Tcm F1 monooxygenase [Streptomyces olivaceus]CAP12597.1 TcmF1 monooxygenase [Streptomyces olivaceus]